METFLTKDNCIKLLIGSKNLLEQKLQIKNVDENELKTLLNKIILIIKDKYNNDNNDLKKLNNICLTNIKNYYVNKKTDNVKNNLETIPEEKENNIHKSITEETKLEDNLLDLKIKELEFLRDEQIPDYNIEDDYTINNKISSDVSGNTIINYNSSKKEENIFYKTLLITSINRDWSLNPFRNNINFDTKLFNFNEYKYSCYGLLLPSYVSDLTPIIKMNIKNNVDDIFYNFVCTTNNKNNWNMWKTNDNVDIILNEKFFNITFYNYTNNVLDLGNDNIKINNFSNYDYHGKDCVKLCINYDYFNINNNLFNINDIISIKLNNNKYFNAKIIYIQQVSNNFELIIINNNNIIDYIDNNSTIMICKNQFNLMLKYYVK